MASGTDIELALQSERKRTSKEEQLIAEARKVLIQNKLHERNILNNLKFYNTSFEFLDEDEIPADKIFSPAQIKQVCKKLHLRFLPSQAFEGEVPYEAVLKIEELDTKYRKELKHFKIISTKEFFYEHDNKDQALLFAQTISGSYYHIHTWGKRLSGWRKTQYFVLRNFESLAFVLALLTLAESLVIPNRYLSTDPHVGYFSMYRMAAYFHLLILQAGLIVFLLFAFHLGFAENNWDSPVKKKKV